MSIYNACLMRFSKWFDASEDRIKTFTRELLEERLLVSKYDFDCSCSNRCVAYDYVINDKLFECQECGKSYNKDYIFEKGELVFEIDKSEILEYQQEEIDYKNIAKEAGDNVISFATDKREVTKVTEVNNINIYGDVKNSQIMQGSEYSQQQSGCAEVDYEKILKELQQIQKYTLQQTFEDEFGLDAEQVKALIEQAIEATQKAESAHKIKEILGKISSIANGAIQGVLTVGIKAIVEKMVDGF